MKKILTLLFALGTITTVFAQYGHHDESRDVILAPRGGVYNGGGYNDGRIIDLRQRDERIREINWRYDNQIAAVSANRYLRHGDRKRQIRMLEAQRREEISQVNLRYENSRRSDRWNRRY